MVTNADEILIELMETSPQLRQEFEDNFKLKQDPRITKMVNFAHQPRRISSFGMF